MTIVTRFAPSPTGVVHVGSVRTALFSWLYARQSEGKFLLRIEDTDRARSTPEFTSVILETLDWLGMTPDEPPIYQSDRTQIYQEVAADLVRNGYAYHCVCSKERLDKLRKSQEQEGIKPRYDRKCRELGIEPSANEQSVIRFKNPLEGEVVVKDLVQGEVTYRNSELDDLIIIRSDGSPTYNFSVVVDEIALGVTHVIRGDDHLNNSPRQINMFRALGAELPKFGHVPMILSAEGKKISKRENPSSVLDYRDRGFLPEAILNYLVRLGWSHGDQEVFSLDEMIGQFDIQRIHRSPASLDEKKLEWLNQQHIMNGEPERIVQLLKEIFQSRGIDTESCGPDLIDLFEVQKARSKTLVEFVDRSVYFYQDFADYDEVAAAKFLTSESGRLISLLKDRLTQLSQWTKEEIHNVLSNVVAENGVKFVAIAQPVRVALTGNTISPGIDVTIALIGREKVIVRLEKAIKWIGRETQLR